MNADNADNRMLVVVRSRSSTNYKAAYLIMRLCEAVSAFICVHLRPYCRFQPSP
jgi:hypothetical protein